MAVDLFGNEFDWNEVDKQKNKENTFDLVCELNFLMTSRVFDVCRIKKGSPIYIVTLKTSEGEGTCISCKDCMEKYKTEQFFISAREATKSETTKIYGCE